MDIKIKGLHKVYDEENSIQYPDIIFSSDKTYMIIGGSGCGKTTLMNMIAGITDFNDGDIEIDGISQKSLTQKQKDNYRVKNIGYIYQDYKLLENMTVRDNLEVLKLEGIDISNMDSILEKLNILDKKNQKICNLSGGQKQRVAIARAMIKRPKLLLCDEPTGNLNVEIGHKIIEDIIRIVKENTDSLMITVSHDNSLMEYFDNTIRL